MNEKKIPDLAKLSGLWLLIAKYAARLGLLLISTGAFAAGIVGQGDDHASYTIPYSAAPHGQIVVQAKVDGRLEGTFLVDTGTSVNLITKALVSELALKPLPLPPEQSPLWEGKPAMLVSPDLQIGTLTLRGGAYVVVSDATTRSLTAIVGQSVDGVIGMQTLRYLAIEIDFSAHQITIVSPGSLSGGAVQRFGFGNSFVVPLVPTLDGKTLDDPGKVATDPNAYWNLTYDVPVRIGDGTRSLQQRLQLDTGSVVTVFASEAVSSLGLKTDGTDAGQGLDGPRLTDLIVVPSIYIGNLCLRDRHAYCYRAGQGQSSPLLGLDVFSGYRVLLDFAAKTMYLAPPAPAVPTLKLKTGG